MTNDGNKNLALGADAHVGEDSIQRRCKRTPISDEEPELGVRPIGEDLRLRGSQCRPPRAHVPLELRLFLILHRGRARSGSWLREQVVGISRRASDPEVDQVVLFKFRGQPGLAYSIICDVLRRLV